MKKSARRADPRSEGVVQDFLITIDIVNQGSDKKTFEQIANESGLAIAIVDGSLREVYVANNNSICRHLNPTGSLSPVCAAYCGKALERVTETGKAARFECHAGLECRAVPVKNPNTPLVAIIGRTFVKAENYRKATERAIEGDWKNFPPGEFFENVLLASSGNILDRTAKLVLDVITRTKAEKKVQSQKAEVKLDPATPAAVGSDRGFSGIVEKFNREMQLDPNISVEHPKPSLKQRLKAAETLVQQPKPVPFSEPEHPASRSAQARAWRSFFGSLLKTDYPRVRISILEFIAAQYGFSSLVWLDRKNGKLENTAAFGEMMSRRVRLGIAADDERLVEAAEKDQPLELGERAGSSKGRRTMTLFPISVAGEITAAVAVLDPIDEKAKSQIVRMCHTLAPQLEILRLRCEVARRESLAGAVSKFSQSLRHIDADGFWLTLIQNAAELMRAERASLLIYDEKSDKLAVKAVVGVKTWSKRNGEIGGRVAKHVFGKNQAVAVANVATTGLPPASPERQYRSASFLSCPITVGDRAIGVMNFTDKAGGGTFDRSSIEIFQSIAPALAVAVDRASLKNKAGEFEQLSVTDPLTGLLNRRYIEARLAEEIKRSNRHGFPMSFMMLDVDQFKSYNDNFGHPAGDEALKLVGHVIRETLRGADVAARFGGEEFSILLPQTTREEAIAIGERIRHNIEQTEFPHRRVTTSIGIASCSAELCASADLVSAADRALYEAKRQGRNRVLAFEDLKA